MRSILYILICWVICFVSCSKADDWLDKKLNLSDVTPETLEHFQAILDNDGVLNFNYPAIGLGASDNLFVDDENFDQLPPVEKNVYLWQEQIFQEDFVPDWVNGYQAIFYANTVLDGLEDIAETAANKNKRKELKGGALFFRAFQFHNLVQTFALPFSSENLEQPGIPLRTSSDVNIRYERASVKLVYEQVIADLKEAHSLLPAGSSVKTRPNKIAAEALLARVYLDMGDYANALSYAESALSKKSDLVDFNSIDTTTRISFPRLPAGGSPEIIFYAVTSSTYRLCFGLGLSFVDSVLVNSYRGGDLRRGVFYAADTRLPEQRKFKGSYTGTFQFFSGLATNELFFIKAECLVRLGRVADGIATLNEVMATRWLSGEFAPFAETDAEKALTLVLEERRKETPFTGQLRWTDLRRLNSVGKRPTTLTRSIQGNLYELLPNSKRYAYPIPNDEVRLFGLTQNDRK